MQTKHVLSSLVIGLVLTGCGKDGETTGATTKTTTNNDTGAEEGNSSTGGAEGGTTGTPVTSTDPNPTTGMGATDAETGQPATSSAGSSTGCGFICDTTGGDPNTKECDIWKQDCPEMEKCMPYANDGGGSWNATKCTSVDANPGQPGDECVAEGGGVSGIDNCAVGTMCWFLDAENKGTCVEMCTGSPNAPMCPGDKICDESNDGVIIVCLDTCDPLAQSCPENQICFFDGVDTFICDFDASGEEGQYGDPCAYINVCDYGLFCANQMAVPGCESTDGCCSTYCNLMEPNTCPGAPEQECVPWYAEGQTPPPGQENIGACAVPI